MRVLVTGAGGQLGREWVAALRMTEHPYLACTSAELDITNDSSVAEVLDRFRPDVIVNCAAWTDVDGAESAVRQAMAVNADGPGILAAWCARQNRRLVHFSTDYVFQGDPGDELLYPSGYPEMAQTAPVNRYGESKLAGEKRIAASGASHLIIRLSWLCGIYGKNFLTTMLRLAESRRNLRVVDDQIGSPTWADRVPPATLRLLERGEEGIFHFSSEGRLSWYGLARELFEQAGREVSLEPVTTEEFGAIAPRPRWSRLDNRKVAEATGLAPELWRDGLQRFLNRLDQSRNL